MKIKLKKLCTADDIRVYKDHVEVFFKDRRKHKVEIYDMDDHFLLFTIVARQSAVREIEEPEISAWKRNRSVSLVGFRVDERGRMVGETRVPKVGLKANEFQIYLRTIAAESDRFEYLITGKDVE